MNTRKMSALLLVAIILAITGCGQQQSTTTSTTTPTTTEKDEPMIDVVFETKEGLKSTFYPNSHDSAIDPMISVSNENGEEVLSLILRPWDDSARNFVKDEILKEMTVDKRLPSLEKKIGIFLKAIEKDSFQIVETNLGPGILLATVTLLDEHTVIYSLTCYIKLKSGVLCIYQGLHQSEKPSVDDFSILYRCIDTIAPVNGGE